jgi:DNA topoisomerase-3
VDKIVNACDAGREGELIFRLIEQYAGGAKPLGKPVSRLWLQSMTPQAIRDGFDHLRTNAQMQPLADAARCRSEADWLVGINGTRAMTAFNSRDGGFFLTTVGRVQTPTLSVVVEREEQIRKFISRDYWEIHAASMPRPVNTRPSGSTRRGKKTRTTPRRRPTASGPNVKRRPLPDAVRGQPATVTEESKPTTQASPLLFDLTIPAARGQWQVWLFRQDHAVHRAKPVRAPQGPDLPAYRFAQPARRLRARGERHHGACWPTAA